MNLKDLRKKIKRKMSAESKKQFIGELREEILKVCPFNFDPQGDAETARKMVEQNEEIRKQVREKGYKGELIDFPDWPVNDLSEIDDKDLTKQQLLENLGCMLMQELFPLNLRLQFLNACEVYRREIKEAKEKGLPIPHQNIGGFFEIEPEEHRLERCFGICRDQNRKF